MRKSASFKINGTEWVTTVDYDNDDFQNSSQTFDRDGEDISRGNVPPAIRAKLETAVKSQIFGGR